MSIPGWVFAVIGVAVASYSKFVQSRSAQPKGVLTLFFWVGIALLVYGVFKTGIWYMTREKASRREKADASVSGRRPSYARDHIVCARCNVKLHPRSRYCNWCGAKQ